MNKTFLNKIKVIAVVGATASGKTSYSIELAKQIDAEIISADSRLVYNGFNIGTAKPTKSEMQGIPHHMIDIVAPEINYSAGLYLKQAKEKIYEISGRDKIPIIVGGTGLYIDVLLKNYKLPQFKANQELRNKLSRISTPDLYDMFLEKNKGLDDAIDPNDRKKIIRAIEIISESGKPLRLARAMGTQEFDVEWIGRNFERHDLYTRINERVDVMIEKGLVAETKKLLNTHGRIPNLIGTIGYREIISFIDGKCSLDEAVAKLKQNTRNYAKRQLTWFRKNNDIKWNIYPETLKK